MLKGLIGKKIGMTQIFDDSGAAIPIKIQYDGSVSFSARQFPRRYQKSYPDSFLEADMVCICEPGVKKNIPDQEKFSFPVCQDS